MRQARKKLTLVGFLCIAILLFGHVVADLGGPERLSTWLLASQVVLAILGIFAAVRWLLDGKPEKGREGSNCVTNQNRT